MLHGVDNVLEQLAAFWANSKVHTVGHNKHDTHSLNLCSSFAQCSGGVGRSSSWSCRQLLFFNVLSVSYPN